MFVKNTIIVRYSNSLLCIGEPIFRLANYISLHALQPTPKLKKFDCPSTLLIHSYVIMHSPVKINENLQIKLQQQIDVN